MKGGLAHADRAGEYDMQVALTLRFGWTLAEIVEHPSDYLEELVAAMQAQGKVDKERTARARKKAGRRGRGAGGRRPDELDADNDG